MNKFLIFTFTILTFIAPAYFCNAMSITSFSPIEGRTNTQVTINGIDFKDVSSVLFGGVPTSIKSINGTTITVEVPFLAVTGKITIRTSATDILSLTDFKVLPNSITFSPESGKVNDIVKVSSNLEIRGLEAVIFSGNENNTFIPSDNSQIYFVDAIIPKGAITGKVSIKTPKYGVITSSTDFTITPVIGIGNTGGVPPTPPDIGTPTTTTYKVVSGDTLGGIATKFSTTIAKLMELNTIITNQNNITVGWVLTVPNTPVTPAITFDNKSLVPTCNTGVIDAEGNYINKCDFNMVMALVNKVISFCLIYLATPLFALIMIYVGYLYLTASGSSENINLAKKILKNALFGYVIALAAWLVVKSVLASLGVIGIDTFIK